MHFWKISLSVVCLCWFENVARADFKLPVLNPVPKVLSVPQNIPVSFLERFADVKDLTLEIRLHHNNPLPDTLISLLRDRFKSAKKRIMLQGNLKPMLVEQLRTLEQWEAFYTVSSEGLDPKVVETLYALGPIRKTLVLPHPFTEDVFKAAGRVRFSTPAFSLPPGESFSKEQIDWLAKERSRRKLFYLPAALEPDQLYDLLALSPLAFEVQTIKNRVPDELLSVLKDLKDVEITLAVDGHITVEDARQWARLVNFSLRIEVEDPNDITPGLPQLLNQINPPNPP